MSETLGRSLRCARPTLQGTSAAPLAPRGPAVGTRAPRLKKWGWWPGRNRTTDTRIFSTAECPARREKAEDAQQVSRGPTEPLRPTEPMPNGNAAGPSGGTLRPCPSTARARPDRTFSELAPSGHRLRQRSLARLLPTQSGYPGFLSSVLKRSLVLLHLERADVRTVAASRVGR